MQQSTFHFGRCYGCKQKGFTRRRDRAKLASARGTGAAGGGGSLSVTGTVTTTSTASGSAGGATQAGSRGAARPALGLPTRA